MVPNSGAENGPEFGTEMRERSPGSPSPRVRVNKLHELLGRSLRIRLLWLASPGQPTGGDQGQGTAFQGFQLPQK